MALAVLAWTQTARGLIDSLAEVGQLPDVKRKADKVAETAAPYLTRRGGKSRKHNRVFTAIIQREDDGFVSLCPELDVASQGGTVEEARTNLAEAVQLFLETASRTEINERLQGETYVTKLEVALG